MIYINKKRSQVGVMTTEELKKYLIENSTIDEKTGCWNWDLCLDGRGYGYSRRNKFTSRSAHRLSYYLFVGPIAEGLFVCHHCDNPKCINPEHLFIGTQKDNMMDMAAKGRGHIEDHKGKKNPFYGKRHTAEAKRRTGMANAIHQKGAGNSQYGTCWIYNEKISETMRISRDKLSLWESLGWCKGRKLNFGV